MGMLAFFPWITLETQLNHGEFRLLPFERGRSPAGPDTPLQRTIDEVLLSYCSRPDHPVRAAVILTHEGRPDFTADLTAEDIASYFVFGDSFAFSALAARTFFDTGYANTDCYRLVIQAFRAESRSVAVESRRRDGSTVSLHPAGSFTESRPHHVSITATKVDQHLLLGLLNARARGDWDRYYEAIANFNLANTDSQQIPIHTEAVLLIGALQRALNCRSSDVNELCERLHDLFKPSAPKSPTTCRATSPDPGVMAKFQRGPSVTDGWIRDFCALRGNLAHGRLTPVYPSIWNVHEHLLLGAFLFPLVVKLVLAREGLYSLTETDRVDIDLFEELACVRHFDRDYTPGATAPWREIRNPLRMAIRTLRLDLDRRTGPGDTG